MNVSVALAFSFVDSQTCGVWRSGHKIRLIPLLQLMPAFSLHFYNSLVKESNVNNKAHVFQYISKVDTSDYSQRIERIQLKKILNQFQIVQDTLSFTKAAS